MRAAGAFLQCLVEGDYRGVRRLFAALHPHLPAPASDEQAEIALHMARTQTQSVPFDLRAWSHSWLVERGYPSQLPDELKPKAERIYPRVVSAVGIAMKATNPDRQPETLYIRGKMEAVVADMFATDKGVPDPELVSKRMLETRIAETAKLRRAVFMLRE